MSKPQDSHKCVLCETKLESKEALQEHFRKHANKEIDLKGRKLNTNGEIVREAEQGSYIRGTGSQVNTNIVCDLCGEAFTCNTKAIRHMYKKHPYNSAKHYCPQCGMQFPLKAHRDKHLADEHQSDYVPKNPYPCYQCGYVFYNQRAHEYHDKSAHHRVVTLYKQIQTPPPTKKIRYNNAGEPQSVYYCHLCGIEYMVKFNLQKHLERHHTAEERNSMPSELFKCNTCDGLFYNCKAYQSHNIYHRPDDLYVTSEEQRLQTVARVDQDFDIRRVQPIVEKYIPRYRRRRQTTAVLLPRPEPTLDDEELSPPPDDDSDSEGDKDKRESDDNREEKEQDGTDKMGLEAPEKEVVPREEDEKGRGSGAAEDGSTENQEEGDNTAAGGLLRIETKSVK